ncbi:MAG: serine hydrolase domain-containing protein [Pseudomarimonas sp.]
MLRRLLIVSLVVLAGCATPVRQPVVESGLPAVIAHPELGAYMASQFRADTPGGVVLVARGSEVLLHQAYGMADVSTQRAMTVTQPLPLGSITKSFTAASVLTLVDTGVVGLSDDIRWHVTRAGVRERVVTVEQLLTHTSGLPNIVDMVDFPRWAKQPRTTAELIAHIANEDFHFEPGNGFYYSDSGYFLLGELLERQLGSSWHAAIRARVGLPLGLNSVESAENLGPRAAVGYTKAGDWYMPAEMIHPSVPHASGGLVATAADVLGWVRAWRDGRLLTPALREKAWSGRTLPNGVHSSYGFGWKRHPFESHDAVQHGGFVPGYTASLLHLPTLDLTAIVLLNTDSGIEASNLARRALRLLLTGSPDLIVHPLSEAERAGLAGLFRSDRGKEWTLIADADDLHIDLAGERVDLVAISADSLCAADSDGSWCFAIGRDASGRAVTIAAALNGEPQARAQRIE